MTKKEYDAQRYLKQKEKLLKQSKDYYDRNKDKVLERHAKWRSENKEAAKICEKLWRLKNPGRARAKVRNYQASKLRAVPKWANKKEIAQFYANCPAEHEVDHIIPLQGKIVSGLHVLNNLQYLPISENRKKSNKF